MKASRKSESINQVRGSLDYAISVMERQIRNADKVDVDLSIPSITLYDKNESETHIFSCVVGPGGSIVWIEDPNGAIKIDSITGQNVIIDDCDFQRILPPPNKGSPIG